MLVVEHTVRVVHPSIGRGVMEERTIVVGIGSVILIGYLHLIPCDGLTAKAHIKVESIEVNALQVERHIEVHFALCSETKHLVAVEMVVLDELHVVLRPVVLNRKKQIAIVPLHANVHVVRTGLLVGHSCYTWSDGAYNSQNSYE